MSCLSWNSNLTEHPVFCLATLLQEEFQLVVQKVGQGFRRLVRAGNVAWESWPEMRNEVLEVDVSPS